MVTREKILKVKDSRRHRITGSLGVYDAYKHLRKNKWPNGQALTEHQFYSIVRGVNDLLADNLANGIEVVFPYRMGKIEVRKHNAYIYFDEKGNLKTNLPIDWDRTLRLWCEDKKSMESKILVRHEKKEIYKVYYNKFKCNYPNSSFYEFNVNRSIKKRLKQNIREGNIDAYFINYGK